MESDKYFIFDQQSKGNQSNNTDNLEKTSNNQKIIKNTILPSQIEPQENNNSDQSEYHYLVKDLAFNQQKQFLLGIVSMFVAWSIFQFIIYQFSKDILLSFITNFENEQPFPIIFGILVIITVILIYIGKGNYVKQQYYPLALFLVTVSAYALTCLFFELTFSYLDTKSEHIISYIQMAFQVYGFWTNLLMMLYLVIEQRQIIFKKFFIFWLILTFSMSLVFFVNTYEDMIIALPYTILLINVLRQIKQGRFKLRSSEVIRGTMAANYGLFIFCSFRD